MNNRVSILSAFKNAGYDSSNSALLALVDYLRCYSYPNRGINPSNSIVGFEGDSVYVQVPFRVQTAAFDGVRPILGKVQLQIIASKSGSEDFVLEQYQADLSDTCRFEDVQQVNISQDKGYISY